MYFKQFLHDETGCASYFLASRQSREAAIIDPQLNIQPYLDLAEERDYRITDVVDTHLHADHVSGNRKLSAATGARLWLHESADVRFPFNPLKDGQELRLGQLLIRAIHTPGHRPESVCLLVTNPPRSPMPSILLSGDTLFVGDVGRSDFGGPAGARLAGPDARAGGRRARAARVRRRTPAWRTVDPPGGAGATPGGAAARSRPARRVRGRHPLRPSGSLPEANWLFARDKPGGWHGCLASGRLADGARARMTQPLTPELLIYGIVAAGDPQLSPDGARVVYSLGRADREHDRGTSQIWQSDLDGANPRQLTWTGDRNREARWSPDGRSIAFVSDRLQGSSGLFVLPMDAPGEARELTRHRQPIG